MDTWSIDASTGNQRPSVSLWIDIRKVVLLAPRGERGEWPEKPTAQLGKGSIQQIAYPPDGKLLAASGGPGIWLYDADSLDEIALLEGHKYGPLCVALRPDGELMASGGKSCSKVPKSSF